MQVQLLKMQPTFCVNVPTNADDTVDRIRRAIQTQDLHGLAEAAGRCVEFKVESSNRRFWSPHLSVQVSDTEQGPELFGRFSPRPEIWTMFMAIYFVAAICVFASVIAGYVQWSLGSAPWAPALIPVSLAVVAALHVASLIGQNLSSDQMQLLRSRLDRAIDLAFPNSPIGAKSDDAIR